MYLKEFNKKDIELIQKRALNAIVFEWQAPPSLLNQGASRRLFCAGPQRTAHSLNPPFEIQKLKPAPHAGMLAQS